MKFTLSIGVLQNFRKAYDHTFEKKLQEKLRKLGIANGRGDTNHDIVEARWRFEGILTDPDYVSARTDVLLGITKDPFTIVRFVIDTNDCALDGKRLNFPFCVVKGEIIDILCFKHSVGMYLFQRTRDSEHSLEDIARGFQRMCEWFTIQTSVYKALGQGRAELTKHHRYAAASAKLTEGQDLILQNLRFPPAIP